MMRSQTHVFLFAVLMGVTPSWAFFEQMFGGGGFGGQRRQRRPQVQYAQFPSGITEDIHENFEWLMDTEWNWNKWRNVKFNSDGIFDAPTDDCQALEGACRWSASKAKVYIMWGTSGLHVLKANQMKADEATILKGRRKKDNDKCIARYVGSFASEDEDLYEILGIEEDATERQIKKAFRKLSIQYHPDKQKTQEEKETAKAMFQKIVTAHDVLSDPDKRILYDNGGMEMVNDPSNQEGGGHDPFAAFFGGGGGNRGRNKGADYRTEIQVDLADMYNGRSLQTSLKRRVVCRGCKKRSQKKKPKCQQCGKCPDEIKMVKRQMGPGMFVQQQMQVASKEMCKEEEAKLEIVIEKGMADRSEVKFERMSEQKPGEIPGDVIFILKTKRHSRFKRTGNDLRMKLTITLKEALLGFTRTIPHLDGHQVTISSDGVTPPGTIMKIGDEGMPVHNFPTDRGDLFIDISIRFPSKLSKEQLSRIQAAF